MKKTFAILLTALSLTAISLEVDANQNPRSMAADNRMKTVAYNANDVVTIIGSHFVETGIQFAQTERVISVDVGDSDAWQVKVNKEIPNRVTIKPILLSSDGNMTVVTDKRIYQFHLITHPGDTPVSKNVTYNVNFCYPDQDQSELQQQLTSLSKTFLGNNATGTPMPFNDNYSFTGSHVIAPIQAVDNGTFTVFRFPKNTVIPAIFSVDRNRNESLLNFRVQGDYVFIQGIYHQFTLRNGKEVTTVYNDSYSV